MPKIMYRPLATSLKPADGASLRSSTSALRYFWSSSATTRNSIAFATIIFLIVVYVVWSTTTAASTTTSHHAGNFQAPHVFFQAAHIQQPMTMLSKSMQVVAIGKSLHNESLSPVADAAVEAMPKTTTLISNDKMLVCSENFSDARKYVQNKPSRVYSNLSTIYFVTPTYPRREQIPELTRLAHTLMHVPQLHWIVANDYHACNIFLDCHLNKFGIPYTYLSSPMPETYRHVKDVPRGVSNRRAAINWLRQRNVTNGVLYFGDDDNTFDLKLFSEIRDTRRVSMFPVGLIGEYAVSGPVVKEGKVIGFFDSWTANRRWPVDMAGFAVNLAYLAEHPKATMPYAAGYEEDHFLKSIALKLDYIEPRGNNCTEILVWHTRTQKGKMPTIRLNSMYLDERSNLGALLKQLETMGIAHASENEGVRAVISRNGKPKPIDYFLQ